MTLFGQAQEIIIQETTHCLSFFVSQDVKLKLDANSIKINSATPSNEGRGNLSLNCYGLLSTPSSNSMITPNVVADRLHHHFSNSTMDIKSIFSQVSADKSFVNFYLSLDYLMQCAKMVVFNKNTANKTSKKIMLEYSQPNTHKAFHVGHMRNAALGDCLVRMFEFLGHSVVATNYFGDEGSHIATCLWQILREYPEPDGVNRFFKAGAKISDDDLGEWLGSFYAQGMNALDLSSVTSLPFSGFIAARIVGFSPILNDKEEKFKDESKKVKNCLVKIAIKSPSKMSELIDVVCGGIDLSSTGHKIGDIVAYAPIGSLFKSRVVGKLEKNGILSSGILLTPNELGMTSTSPYFAHLGDNEKISHAMNKVFVLPHSMRDNTNIIGQSLCNIGRLTTFDEKLDVETEIKNRQSAVQSILHIMETMASPTTLDINVDKNVKEEIKKIKILLDTTKKWSLDEFKRIYKWLNVRFDHDFYESKVSVSSLALVNKFKDSGLLHESNGCYGIDFNKCCPNESKFEIQKIGKKEEKLPFCMLLKSNGSGLYATKDLALAMTKFQDFKIDQSIYVVASEQSLHFKQVFKSLEVLGLLTPQQVSKCHHVPYGMVKLKSGKMSSRQGTVIYFNLLKKQLNDFIIDKYPNTLELSCADGGISAVHAISLATIKFGMLKCDSMADITFDLGDWGKQTGNTGPYLLYVYARMRSIINKVGESKVEAKTRPVNYELLTEPRERMMLSMIAEFWTNVESVVEKYNPAPFCKYLYEFCRYFNSWFENCPPLVKEENSTVLATRLEFLNLTSIFLKRGLYLLGIETLEHM